MLVPAAYIWPTSSLQDPRLDLIVFNFSHLQLVHDNWYCEFFCFGSELWKLGKLYNFLKVHGRFFLDSLPLSSDLLPASKDVLPGLSFYWYARCSQVVGTLLAGFVNVSCAYWLYEAEPLLCAESGDWTCPAATNGFSVATIWGLIGTRRMFGDIGRYKNMTWMFLFGAIAPIPFWALAKMSPKLEVRLLCTAPRSMERPSRKVNNKCFFKQAISQSDLFFCCSSWSGFICQ